MGAESHFRPNRYQLRSQENLHNLFKRLALLIDSGGSVHSKSDYIALEETPQDSKEITGRTYLYQSNSGGYLYRVGRSNDVRIDIEEPQNHIYLICFRYGEKEEMSTLCQAMCQMLGMHFIYNLSFERKILQEIHPFINNSDEDDVYAESRKMIKSALKTLRRFPEDLDNVEIQKEVLDYIKTGSKPT